MKSGIRSRLGLRGMVLLAAGVLFWLPGLCRSLSPQAAAASPFPRISPGPAEVSAALAWALKAGVAEAFIIPTGGMAETLWGYQKLVTCPECRLRFPVNCSSEVDPADRIQRFVGSCVCPNCRKKIDLQQSPPGKLNKEENNPGGATMIPDPGWFSGDRILAAKGLLSRLEKPARFAPVVFEYPITDPDRPAPVRYVKRLVGLPGETIAIRAGKLYVLPREQSPQYKDPPLPRHSTKTPQEQEAQRVGQMHPNDKAALDLFRKGKFQILRRPADTVLAMKRLVYDNDHQAKDLSKLIPPRWASEDKTTWRDDGSNGFRHAAAAQAKLSWLRYSHLLRPRQPVGNKEKLTIKPELIADFMGYNSNPFDGGPEMGDNWVGDLILECEVTVEQAKGELILELLRGVDRFQAQWDLSTGRCTLLRLSGDKQPARKKLDSKETPVKQGTYQLRLANVDEQLLLWVDNKLLGPGVAYDSAPTPGPTSNDLQPASVGVKGASVQVKHLKLFRDTYYLVSQGVPLNPPGGADGRADLSDPATWELLRHPQIQTLYVQPGHFLCLGDNSPRSADSRYWGAVPDENLLGKVLLRYYPLFRLGPVW